MTTTATAAPVRPERDRRSDGLPRRGQGSLVTLACLALVPALVMTFLRVVPPRDDPTALAASFIPYGLLGYLVALLLLAVALLRARRRRGLALLSTAVAALTAWQLSWIVPFFVADDRPATTAPFTVLSLNTYAGQADPAEVWAEAQQADVVVLVEITPEAVHALKDLGWSQRFPYSVGDLHADISDTAVYSRFPLSNSALLGDTSFQQWVSTVSVPDLGPVRLIAAHPCNPYCGYGRWYTEHQVLSQAVAANDHGRLVVAGDFNAVDDHGPMQALHRAGLESATDIAGAGWLPTWPANRSFPPLIPIDHVLVNPSMTATAVRTFHVQGTDHEGVLATLAGAG